MRLADVRSGLIPGAADTREIAYEEIGGIYRRYADGSCKSVFT